MPFAQNLIWALCRLVTFTPAAAAAAKVRFEYLPANSDHEHRVWELATESKKDADVQTLQGWREYQALGELQLSLKRWGHENSPESMEKWLLDLGFSYCHVS